MDPLSVLASVTGLIALTIKTMAAIDNYATTTKDAPAEIQSLLEELGLLQGILKDIEKTFLKKATEPRKEGSDDDSTEHADTLVRTISGCQTHLLRAVDMLKDYGIPDGTMAKAKGNTYKTLFKRLRYPFDRSYIQRLLTVIRDYKASLTLAMSLEEKKSIDVLQTTLARLEAVSVRSEENMIDLSEQTNQLLSALIVAMDDIKPPAYSSTAVAKEERHFVVPLQPTATFVGRLDVMDKIQNHFSRDAAAEQQQQRCAIYGLGGSGKTQIALKFAFTRKSNYQNVFFINAASRDSATADFVRIHGLLGLPEDGSDLQKLEAVKRWLSKEGNSSWLLILDNADDLEDLDIWHFIPVVEAGDVLITTRDARINDPELATLAIYLEMLPLENAVQLLSKRAAIQSTLSREEQLAAERVATELGCLPLAMDQAGAYMNARKKSFVQYSDLYHKHQESLLGYKHKLSRHQKTVLTTWDLSFHKINSEAPDVASLFLLLCQYDNAYIAENMLKRGSVSQLSFGRNGEEIQLPAESSRVPKSLVNLISDEIRFEEAVETLTSYSLIWRAEDGGFVLHSLVQFCGQRQVTEDMRKSSFEASICVLSHAFPRGSLDDCVQFLPQVEHACRRLEKSLAEGDDMVAIHAIAASLFLSAYHFANTHYCQRFVDLSEKLLIKIPPQPGGLMADPEFLAAFLTERRGKVCPELGNSRKGIDILRAFVQNRPSIDANPDAAELDSRSPNKLANSMHGCVFVLLAQQLIDSGRSDEALQYLLQWKPFEPASSSERSVMRYRDRTLANLYVSNENWDKAESMLRLLLSEEMEDSATYSGTLGEGWTIQQLAEILIETGRHEDASTILFPAIALREDAGNLDRQDTISLMLDLVNSLLGQKSINTAISQLFKLRQILAPKGETMDNQDNDASPSQATFSDLTQMWCLVARLSCHLEDWAETKSCFGKALEAARHVQWPNGFMIAVLGRSLAYSRLKLGEVEDVTCATLDRDLEGVDLESGRRLTDAGIDKEWVTLLKETQA
ncbi:hypothetical protein G7Z17_g371 [Cylindrodendrum hubeiense]|uniref:NB-ARC domain-containing protein n=1 Tax=Cylindrodendrum hubeiense TaxID=595255 RepID=A0A9P5LL56_9HYPO|nr:hypothetical protein G7Z17_g371 [Cylindrodendrum hubeiense]